MFYSVDLVRDSSYKHIYFQLVYFLSQHFKGLSGTTLDNIIREENVLQKVPRAFIPFLISSAPLELELC